MSRKNNVTLEGLEREIIHVQELMELSKDVDDQYIRYVDQLEKLYKIKASMRRDHVSPDALVAVIGNLAGIVMIINFETTGVITSKALGFVMKSKM